MTPVRRDRSRRACDLALIGLTLLTSCRSPEGGAAERTPQTVASPATTTSFQSTAPPVEDETTRALRERYEGREVWVYGGGPLTCRSGDRTAEYVGPLGDAVQVLSLRRVAQRAAVPVMRGGAALRREVDTPILVKFRLPDTSTFVGGGTSGSVDDLMRLAGSQDCRTLTEVYADEAHLSRELSLTPPPADVQALWVKQRSQPLGEGGPGSNVGRTRPQVLWLSGAPHVPQGGLPTLMEAEEWSWVGPPGRGDWTLTFQDDRVIAESQPSPSP